MKSASNQPKTIAGSVLRFCLCGILGVSTVFGQDDEIAVPPLEEIGSLDSNPGESFREIQIFDSVGKPVRHASVYSVDPTSNIPFRLKHAVNNEEKNELRDIDSNGRPVVYDTTRSRYAFTRTNSNSIAKVPRSFVHFVVSAGDSEMAFVPADAPDEVWLRKFGQLNLNVSGNSGSHIKGAKAIVIWKNSLAGSYPLKYPMPDQSGKNKDQDQDWRIFPFFELIAVVDLDKATELRIPPGEISIAVVTKHQLELIGLSETKNFLARNVINRFPANNGIHEIVESETTHVDLKVRPSVFGTLKPAGIPDWDTRGKPQPYLLFSVRDGKSFPEYGDTLKYYSALVAPKMKELRAKTGASILPVSIKPNGQFATAPLPVGVYKVLLIRPTSNGPAEFETRKQEREKSNSPFRVGVLRNSRSEVLDLGPIVAVGEPTGIPTSAPKVETLPAEVDDLLEELDFDSVSSTSDEKSRIDTELTKRVLIEFEKRQRERSHELKQLAAEIRDAQHRVEMRSQRSDEIVKRRVEALIRGEEKLPLDDSSPSMEMDDLEEIRPVRDHEIVVDREDVLHIDSPSPPNDTILRFALVDFHGRLSRNKREEYIPLLNEDKVRAAIKTAVQSFEAHYEKARADGKLNEKAFGAFNKCKPLYLKMAETGFYGVGTTIHSFNSLTDANGITYVGFWVRLNVRVDDTNFALPIMDLSYGRVHD